MRDFLYYPKYKKNKRGYHKNVLLELLLATSVSYIKEALIYYISQHYMET